MKSANVLYNILISVHSSEDLKLLLPQAHYFQQLKGAEITILKVIPKATLIKRISKSKQQSLLIEKRAAFTELTLHIGAFYKKDIPSFINIQVVEDDFIRAIKNALKRGLYNLLLIREFNEVRSLLDDLHRVSDKLLHRIDCPVMMLHEKWTSEGIREIFVPLDITLNAKETILWTTKQARQLNARINFVSVINTSVRIQQSLIYKRALMLKNWLENMELDCSVTILQAKPEEMEQCLIDSANNGNSDIVMILTHRRYLASTNHWGNFAKKLIHHSTKPVISMSVRNKPMFRLIGDLNHYSNKRMETLNIKTLDWDKEFNGKTLSKSSSKI